MATLVTAANDKSIAVLNGLIGTTLDSAHGYSDAANVSENSVFKAMLERRAQQRKQLAADLQGEVRNLGGVTEEIRTRTASRDQVFLGLEHALTGSEQGVIAAIEAGEDYIKGKLVEALAVESMPSTTRSVVAAAYDSIKSDQAQLRDLATAPKYNFPT